MAKVSIRGLVRYRSSFYTHVHNSKSSLSSSRNFLSTSSTPCDTPETQTASVFESFHSLLTSCRNIRELFQIQAHMITSGLFRNPFLARTVLKQASDFGYLDHVILVFSCIDSFKTFCVNAVIKAYCASDVPEQAVVFYFVCLQNGFFPNSHTLVWLLGSCARAGCVRIAGKCHGQALKYGFDNVLPVQNSLVHMYGCFGELKMAKNVFDDMMIRDVVSWNSIIDGYARCGDVVGAHLLFDRMPERNVVSWNVMISGYLKGGNPGFGLRLFREMVRREGKGNDTTIVSVLTACGRSARLKEGKSVHGNMLRLLWNSSLIINTALIDMYSRCKRVDVASKVFDRMKNRNLVCWNAMILGHSLHGNPVDGLHLFHEMLGIPRMELKESEQDSVRKHRYHRGGFLPDKVSFVGVLCACARAKLLEEGKYYFNQMIDVYGLKPNFAHFWCIANLLVSMELVHEAEEFLKNMLEFDENLSSESLVCARLLASSRFHQDFCLAEHIAKYLIDKEPWNILYYQFLLNIYAVAGQWQDMSRVREVVKKLRLGRIPGCSLLDLKQVVHDLKLTQNCEELIEVVNMKMGIVTR